MSKPPLSQDQREAQARNRFFLLALLRFAGVGLVMVGIALMVDRVPGFFGSSSRIGGLVVALFGAFDVLIAPMLLVRMWKRGEADQ
jgi:hypothetical protein